MALRRAVLVALALLILPTSASAATIAYDNGVLVWTATEGDDVPDVYPGVDGGPFTIDSLSSIEGPVPAGCDVSFGKATCAVDAQLGVRLNMLGGNDFVTIDHQAQRNLKIVVDGGPGKDNITGSPYAGTGEVLLGGEGDDILQGYDGHDELHGGPGNDQVDGGAGADAVFGDEGDDKLIGDGDISARSSDVLDGGPGQDGVEDWSRGTGPISVTLAGGADDGTAGENDDVRNVETIFTSASGRLVGTDAADRFFVTNGAMTLEGLGGDDELRGAGGPDALDGGAGADKLVAGAGDDVITGGAGPDVIVADTEIDVCSSITCVPGSGNDVVNARDGEVDRIACGLGTDKVVADGSDVVDPDCEQVDRGAGPSGPDGPNGPNGPNGPDGPTTTKAKVTVARTSLKTALAKGLKVSVRGAKAGKRVATVKRGKTSLARRTVTVPSTGKATFRLTFSKTAKRTLKRTKKVTLTVAVGGASAKVTLKR